mmetsp:Transcript_84162/g.233247  ORF Transcript_84162/g.233247 Transcript_84162/m.233247 type:complete len:317 (+) Transcript_84162:633-1583(+)
MATVARWSATTCWNSWFSAWRCSPAALSATCASATLALSSAISFLSPSSVPSRPAICASRSLFSLCFSRVSSSFASMSFMQDSCFSYSSCCCFLSSAIILSIASLTFSKPSSCTPTARVARRQPPEPLPRRWRAARSREAARTRSCWPLRPVSCWWPLPAWRAAPVPRRCLSLLVCTKLSVFEKRSRASSSVRIRMASAIACTSSCLVFFRSSYSESALAHRSLRSMRNFSSALRASRVSTTSALACATRWSVSASSALFSSTDLPLASISPSLAARSCWKATSASKSARIACARSFWKVACICCSIPKIEELREP